VRRRRGLGKGCREGVIGEVQQKPEERELLKL
jgi:hypothetical protein